MPYGLCGLPLESALAALALGVIAFAYGVDFPESNRRFARRADDFLRRRSFFLLAFRFLSIAPAFSAAG
jgi:hypothetical protein